MHQGCALDCHHECWGCLRVQGSQLFFDEGEDNVPEVWGAFLLVGSDGVETLHYMHVGHHVPVLLVNENDVRRILCIHQGHTNLMEPLLIVISPVRVPALVDESHTLIAHEVGTEQEVLVHKGVFLEERRSGAHATSH